MGVARWQFQPIKGRRNMHILSAKLSKIARIFNLLKRIFHMRRLLIQKSLAHSPHMPISYHAFTVRLAEHMMGIKALKNKINSKI